jgi:hypothetical protein
MLQLGLRGALRDEYASGRQIVSIEDITPFVVEMRERALTGPATDTHQWDSLLVPAERDVHLSRELRAHIAADEPV